MLWAIGAVWYADLVALIVSMSEYPGSHQLRDHKLSIALILLFLTGCFWQTYAIWKRSRPAEDE